MRSTIAKRAAMQTYLSELPMVREVYTDTGWDFTSDTAVLYILNNEPFDTVTLYNRLCDVFVKGVKVYCASEWDSLLLEDKQLLWYNGRWHR